VGKGVRGAPRDAMLADLADRTNRGRVYGFHQAMDHIGAVLGPLLATVFLIFYPGRYRMLFALTAIPGALTVVLLRWAKEPGQVDSRQSIVDGQKSKVESTSGPLPTPLVRYLMVLSIFTLGNSTDAFLLLKLTDVAGSTRFIPLLWAVLHVVKASVSVLAGNWSDRIGRRSIIGMGWLVYAAVYVEDLITALDHRERLLPFVVVEGGTAERLGLIELEAAWRRTRADREVS
jgi:MFS family permease